MSYSTVLDRIKKKTGVEMPDWLYHALRRVKDVRYWFLYRLHPNYRYHIIRTGLPPGYYDQDTCMLHVCMALLGEWLEEMGGVNKIAELNKELRDDVADKEHFPGEREMNCKQADFQDEALAIWRWWTVERPENKRNKEQVLEDWHDSEEAKTRAGLLERLSALETKFAEDDEIYLRRLIDIRPKLWV